MNFRQKKDTARRIAKVQHIPIYRNLLKARGSSDADRIMLDKEALARSLVYNLLDFYSEDQILAATSVAPSAAVPAEGTATRRIKKKIQRLKNIRPLPGRILTTLLSALQTAYTRIVSTVSALWQRLRRIQQKP